MPRLAPIIPLDKFKEMCNDKFGFISRSYVDSDVLMDFPKIIKDLSKINFDMENITFGNANPKFIKYPSDYGAYGNYPVGYEVLSNGLPVLFVNAGGDWECPICFCIYFDGTDMRAYIPKNGNVYNVKEKCAYGSEEDPDDDLDVDSIQGDPDLIRQDVVNRIQIIK